MNPIIKIAIALLGIFIGLIQAPLSLTLPMLFLICGLLAQSLFKTAILLKRKQAHTQRLCRFYQRKYNRSEWAPQPPNLPMIQYKNYTW